MAEDSILVRLGINLNDFQRGLQLARRQADSFVMGMTKVASLGFVGGFGLSAIKDKFTALIDSVRSISVASKGIGISVETIQGFQKLTRVVWDAEYAIDKLSKLNEMIGSARLGESGAVKFFEQLGIKLTENGYLKKTDDILRELLDKIGKIPDVSERAKLLSTVFKKGGEDIAGLLNGSDELTKKTKEWTTATKEQLDNVEKGRAVWKSFFGTIRDGFLKFTASAAGGMGSAGIGSAFPMPPKPKEEEIKIKSNQVNSSQQAELENGEEEIKKLKYEQLKPIAKKRQLEEEELKILDRISHTEDGSFENQKAIQDYEKNTLAIEKVQLDIQKQAEEVDKRQSDLREKKNRLEEKSLQLSQAQKDVEKARLDAEISREDRRKFTVSDLAKYEGPQNRFAAWQIRGAKEIQWAEAMAKRAQLFGNTRAAGNYQSYAERVRSMLPALTDAEQNPNKSDHEAVIKSEEHLAVIRKAYENAGKEVPQ